MKFENSKAMYNIIRNDSDLYNINTGDYVFLYSDRGAIAVYNFDIERAKDLSSHSAGEYLGVLLGVGGCIYDNGAELEWCKEYYNDSGWKFTCSLDEKRRDSNNNRREEDLKVDKKATLYDYVRMCNHHDRCNECR